jgi:hypothetical protein
VHGYLERFAGVFALVVTRFIGSEASDKRSASRGATHLMATNIPRLIEKDGVGSLQSVSRLLPFRNEVMFDWHPVFVEIEVARQPAFSRTR